jgi:uncharacterized protein YndB with AHSA1/START domain
LSARIDSASRLISALPETIYRAFAEPGALVQWLPPANMTGAMLHFDFREGGSYRMRLTYKDPQAQVGQTTEDADEFEVQLIGLEAGKRIEQEITFDSSDADFSGTMRMVWTFEPEGEATRVTVRAENVPAGISPEDHETGLKSSLENLTAFVRDQFG